MDLSEDKEDNYVVRVENITFSFNKRLAILKNFTFRVNQGGIFALLGSNGCGKTTVLKLILGKIKPGSGWIRVFGLEPGHKLSDTPEPGVGYMLQEIALSNEFTIRECINYFGNIYKISQRSIEHRTELLSELLSLPAMDKRLSELSGGQQRLVSMAVAIIHRPKLLILDEPTVGVDSIVRQRIWSYLENICNSFGTTVIITTHYIDEAKGADFVGFISKGALLHQANPNELIQTCNCKSLEETLLILCENDHKQRREGMKHQEALSTEEATLPEPGNQLLSNINQSNFNTGLDFQRIGALISKTIIRLKRSGFSLLLFFILPLIIVLTFKVAVGTYPRRIQLAIYTSE